MNQVSGIAAAPVYASDRSGLAQRQLYDFRDYGFEITARTLERFEAVPTRMTEEECFLFFFSREDVAKGSWGLFNLHVFLKRTGSLEDFAHSLGASVRTIALSNVTAYGIAGLGYSRRISMGDLFQGGEAVIGFIGGEPGRMVRDSHFYFRHHYAHCYTGVIHLPGEEARYDALRASLFESVRFLP